MKSGQTASVCDPSMLMSRALACGVLERASSSDADSVVGKGLGVRYLITRQLGSYMGVR